jgi:hypothetical protein
VYCNGIWPFARRRLGKQTLVSAVTNGNKDILSRPRDSYKRQCILEFKSSRDQSDL